MKFEFTPAAQRALLAAARWRPHAKASHSSLVEPLTPPALLLGLLDEPECRAALWLAACAIDEQAVRARWPDLICQAVQPVAWPVLLSADLELALAAAAAQLADLPPPLVLATEHLLLGLAACTHETGAWLRERGIDPAQLQSKIQNIYGITASPLADPECDASPPQRVPQDQCHHAEQSASPNRPTHQSVLLTTGSANAESWLAQPGASMPHLAIERHPNHAEPSGELARVLDAAANRAREALRVLEDYTRFVLDDPYLTAQLKAMRHELVQQLARVPEPARLAARDTPGDVGTALTLASEASRDSLPAVAAANFKRLQEALRSLEEFGKLASPQLGQACESLRYRCYALERAVFVTLPSSQRLGNVRLYVLIDGRGSPEEFAHLASSLVNAGVQALQLRDKRLDDRTLLARARILRDRTRGSGTLCLINDRPDIAALVEADGVHVGQEELPLGQVRRLLRAGALVGLSTHSLEQAREGLNLGADYLGVGPVFPTPTKKFAHYPGLGLLRTVAQEIRLPWFAIGGIGPENIDQVLAAGARRVAVSSAVCNAADPAAVARRLLQRLG